MNRRRFLLSALLPGLLRAQKAPPSRAQGSIQNKEDSLPSAAAIQHELIDGNRRFASNHAKHPHSSSNWIVRTSKAQHPHAAVLCCSDSRVTPEILFDQGIGDLFTIRVAGNVANEDEIASIEYAVEHLHVPLCVVLGHTHCGAVTAVVEGEAEPDEIRHLVMHIGEALKRTLLQSPHLEGSQLIEAVVRTNVWESIEDLFKGGSLLREQARDGRLLVVGALYDIDDGHVTWLGPHPAQSQFLGH